MPNTSATRGTFIAVEGIDGAGKTTQVRLLEQTLTRLGHVVVVSHEPTDGPHGRRIRQSAKTGRMPVEEELKEFILDRTEHVSGLINPSLAAGKTVILDRYFYSSIAYQGLRGSNTEEIRQIMESKFPIPDFVFLIDLDPHIALTRIAQSRGDIPNEFEKIESLIQCRAIFNSLEDSHIFRISGEQTPDLVHAQIMSLVNQAV